MLLEWEKNLFTGIPRLDNQHKAIFENINLLFEVCRHNKSQDDIIKSLKFVEEYTINHFTLEENLQKIYKYPYYHHHKSLHEQFIKDFIEYRDRFKQHDGLSYFADDFNKWLIGWWKHHIINVDMTLAVYLKSKKYQEDVDKN